MDNIVSKLATETAKATTEVAAKAVTKAATKAGGLKVLEKSVPYLAKSVPFLGTITGTASAIFQLAKGRPLLALAEFTSGITSIVPGVGTVISNAITAGVVAYEVCDSLRRNQLENLKNETFQNCLTDLEVLTQEDMNQIEFMLSSILITFLKNIPADQVLRIKLEKFIKSLIAALKSGNIQEVRRLLFEFALEMKCPKLLDILCLLAKYAHLLDGQAKYLNFLDISFLYIRIFVFSAFKIDLRDFICNGRYFLGQTEDFLKMRVNTFALDQNCYYVTLAALKLQTANRFFTETEQMQQNRATMDEIIHLYQEANLNPPRVECLENLITLSNRVLELKRGKPYAVFGLGINEQHMVVLQVTPENLLRIIDFQEDPPRIFNFADNSDHWRPTNNYQLFISDSPAEAMLNLLHLLHNIFS